MKEYKKIKRNRIQCKRCGDIIESVYRHDFKWCSCRSCAVDGGKDYLRRCAVSLDDVIELTEYEDLEESDGQK